MWYKVKTVRTYVLENGKEKEIKECWLTDSENFADAGFKVQKFIIEEMNSDSEVEDVSLLKYMKPMANPETQQMNDEKIFVVKIAETMQTDNGEKELKYAVPAFANNNDELQKLMKEYIAQGLEDMRITTISETKWRYIK